MPNTINYDRLYSKILSDPRVQAYANQVIANKMEKFKKEMLEEFEKDEITQELDNPAGGNISNTLDGKDNKSLFGFIGFNAGSKPTENLRASLQKVSVEQDRIYAGNDAKRIRFKIRMPSFKEICADPANKMHWESGRSWVYGIERGISGFGSFLAQFMPSSKSRSGQGIQLKEEDGETPLVIRPGSFKPRRYISKILENFRNKWLRLRR